MKKQYSNNDLFLNLQYAAVLGTFWFMSAILSVFLIPLLREQGFDTGQTSILIAIRSVSSVLFQPMIASFAQRYSRRIPLNLFILGTSVLGIGTSILHMTLQLSFAIAVWIFIVYGATISCQSSLIDAMSNQYVLSGRKLNYTLARTVGSATWAFASLGFGKWIHFDGNGEVVLLIQATALAVLAIMSMTLEAPKVKSLRSDNEEKTEEEGHSIWYILTGYKEFTLVLVVLMFIFLSHGINMTYLITKIESLGGGTAELGVAQFLLAIAEIFVPLYFVKIKNCFGIDGVIKLSFTAAMIRIITTSLASSVLIIYIGQLVQCLAAMYYSGFVIFIREKIQPDDQIKAQGVLAATQQAAGCLGTIIAAQMLQVTDTATLFNVVSAIAVVGIIILYVGFERIHRVNLKVKEVN